MTSIVIRTHPYPKSKNSARQRKRRHAKRSRLMEWMKSNNPLQIKDIPLDTLPDLPYIKDIGKRKQTLKWYSIWRAKRYKRFTSRMPLFVSICYGVDKTIVESSLKKHIEWYEELVRTKGCVEAVKILKKVRDACVRFASDQTFEPLNMLKCHDDGLPLRVGHLMPLLKSTDIKHRRAAVHVLDIIKLCEVQGDAPTVDSIVNPTPGLDEVKHQFIGETLTRLSQHEKMEQRQTDKVVSNFRSTLQRMFPQQKKSLRLTELSTLQDIHMSVRKGPNGPALGTIIEDFYGIKQSGLLEPITKIAQITNNKELLVILDELTRESETHSSFGGDETFLDSRLAIKYEPWCKTRFFAICDWFSQSALKGLHKWIFKWLSKQPEDGTMSQDSVAELVKSWTAVNDPKTVSQKEIYSLDLSKATDRIPASIQREIIQQIFGKDVADNWYTICTKRSFQTPNGGNVAFAVGQPLGVYSSWAMLALTHHVICRTAISLAGKQRISKNPLYVVIGDDVAMRGTKIAESYSLIMNQILRVDISPIKGFTPKTSLGVNPLLRPQASVSAEIAKRIFVDGFELTVVSPETLLSAMEYPADFPNLLRQLHNRGCVDETVPPVAPISLACLGFNPDIACTFATFPLRPAIPKEMVKAVHETTPAVLSFIPWFQSEIVINDYELETMFRHSIRQTLQSTLDKFEKNFSIYTELSRKPIKRGERVYHFRTQEYIIRLLLNRAILYILELIVETDALNFQGPGQKLDEIASALNTMLDFDLAMKGKPSSKRENLHRLRSRVITKLQPLVLQAIAKAKRYFGILLIDSGEQVNFVPQEWINIETHNLELRGLLTQESNKLLHDEAHHHFLTMVKQRTLEVVGI